MVQVTSVGEKTYDCGIFPNPANEILCVEAEGLQQVAIYNMMGQLVYSQSCDEDGVVINTSRFAPGLYTISIKGITTLTRQFSVVH